MLLVAAIALLGPKDHAKQPSWLDFSIASYILRYDEQHEVMAVHDKKTGYYLTRTVDCDGAIVTITLTKDKSQIEGMKIIDKPLPSLSTGKGITIGDSPERVRKILGKPTDIDKDGGVTYTYQWETKVHGNDGEYDNIYTFKKGKLVEIEFWRSDNSE